MSTLRPPGGGKGKPFPCLENPMDRGAWWATVHGVTKSQAKWKWLSMHSCWGLHCVWYPLYLLLWQESVRGNGVSLIVNKRVQNAVFGCSLKNDWMILVYFQGKPFNITVIQVYAPTTNTIKDEWFYEELKELL